MIATDSSILDARERFGFEKSVGAYGVEKILFATRWNKGNQPLPAVARQDILLVFSTVFVNSAITSAGWLLWRSGYIRISASGRWYEILRDSAVLFLSMDLALYVLHRIAHIPLFYRLAHYRHHEHREVRVLALFIMHPLEALGFGSLFSFGTLTVPDFHFMHYRDEEVNLGFYTRIWDWLFGSAEKNNITESGG